MKALLKRIRQILRNKKVQRIIGRYVSFIAAVVVFVTTYALVLPAITMEARADCGIEAHQHGDTCYEKTLICDLSEEDGHVHTEACYESVLVCGKEVHVHGPECYQSGQGAESSLETAAWSDTAVSASSYPDEATGSSPEDAGDTSADSSEEVNGAGDESASIPLEPTPSDPDGDIEGSGDNSINNSGDLPVGDPSASDPSAAEAGSNGLPTENSDSAAAAGTGSISLPDNNSYVPTLDPLDFRTILTDRTGIYYYRPAEGEMVENSALLTDWNRIEEDTELGVNDLLRVYLAYTIPAGSLNETNPVARYRLPSNLHLTDAQVEAINEAENGIAAQIRENDGQSGELTGTDNPFEGYRYEDYLGVEAVEGTRTPADEIDKYLADHDGQETISAVVRVENIFDEESGEYIGQDLIFTFVPYTVEKNAHRYDASGQPVRAGEEVRGWLTLDFNLEQVEWEEAEAEPTTVEKEDGTVVLLNEQKAAVVFVEKGEDSSGTPIDEISTGLTLVKETAVEKTTDAEETADAGKTTGEDESPESGDPEMEQGELSEGESSEKDQKEYKAGTLTSEGSGYKITLDYKADAKIPEGAYLKVSEITRESDAKAYEACLEEARKTIPDDKKTAVDDKASRFFDIEIMVDEETADGASSTKIEPAAPVSVNIQLFDTEMPETEAAYDADKYKVLHFAEEGVEEIGDVTAQEIETEQVIDSAQETNPPQDQTDSVKSVESDYDAAAVTPATEIRFEAEGFSVYGVVYTVDFHVEVNGQIYTFSMQGADSVSLRALVDIFGIYDDQSYSELEVDGTAGSTRSAEEHEHAGQELSITNAELEEAEAGRNSEQEKAALDLFMSRISDVAFSDTDLLVPAKIVTDTTAGALKSELHLSTVYPLGLSQDEVLALNAKEYAAGDWALISIKPFDTEETLTITMESGEQILIKVTDAQDAQMVGDQVLTVSNPAGTTIDLFDYWIVSQDLVGRDGWGDLNQSQGADQAGDANGLNGTGNNKGINASVTDPEHGHALKFVPAWEGTVYNGSKVGTTGNAWQSVNINGRDGLNSYTGNADPFQTIVQGSLVNGYPILTDNSAIGSNGESLAYLFDPNVSHEGKASYAGVDELLYVDKDGYYTYDSRDYRADYSDGTFTLTEQTSDDGEIRGFWPFGTQNFWSGMHVNTQFSMPQNGQVLNPRGQYNDMQFEFSGDDDTWLYVDGVLVGDGGGIHNRTEIDINFAAGTVIVTGEEAGSHSGDFETTRYLDDIFIAAGKYNEDDWEDIGDGSGHKRFKAGTYHTFDMFYLERGGGESNLYIHYNLISTADFTAHKSYEGYDDDDLMQRNQFRFELIGLDGKYRSVWSEDAGDYVLVQEDTSSKAIMPHASSSGAGTTVSPYYNGNTSTELDDGTTVGSQTYITGNVEDGNVNFGTAEISEQDMHDCDEGNPPVYRYIVREVIPDDAVNADNITWADATPEQKAAGGFVKDSVVYDGTAYYMAARVTKWTETSASGTEVIRYGLSKTYYTDDTYTTERENTPFIDFRNRYTPDHADFEFDKINANEEPVAGAVFGLYRDSACKIPAKNSNSEIVTATSDSQGKVTFTDVRTGIYFMKEVTAPDPYDLNPTVYRVTISRQGSHMSVNSDQNNNPVTEVFNLKPGDLTVNKMWVDAQGREVSGEGYPSTVQLRRYRYVSTAPTPETHTVNLHYHFPLAEWMPDMKDRDFGPYVRTGHSVMIHWSVGGCKFFWDEAKTELITDSSGDNLLEIPLDRDLELHFYGDRDWAASNISESLISVEGTIDDSKELRLDDSFPSADEEAKATCTLTADHHTHAWSIGVGNDYDFPPGDDLGHYYYYLVELDEEGNEVEIGGEVSEGMTLQSIEYSPEKTDGYGITHGLITVTNELDIQYTGSLDITKNIQTNGITDPNRTGTFYYAVYAEDKVEEDGTPRSGTEPDRTGSIAVTENGTETVTESDLPYGTYYVYELVEEGGEPVFSGTNGLVQVIDSTVYKVTGSGTEAVVGDAAGSVVLNNSVETIKAKVHKEWDDNNDQQEKRPAELSVSLYAHTGTDEGNSGSLIQTVTLTEENNWTSDVIEDLPVYDENGELIAYHWVEGDVPPGYFPTNSDKEIIEGVVTTSLTNTLKPYDLKTSYVGTKTWEDNHNGWNTRPNGLTVTLFEIKKTSGSYPETGTALELEPDWTYNNETNQWTYSFGNLPVFDDNGEIIKYYAEETAPGGYTLKDGTGIPTETTWTLGTADAVRITPDRSVVWNLGSLIDLSFLIIKTTDQDFVIWTHRVPTPNEITKINAEGARLFGDFTNEKKRKIYVTGIGRVTTSKGNLDVTYDESELDVTLTFSGTNVWSQYAKGQFSNTQYDIGRTDFTNKLKETQISGTKTWNLSTIQTIDNAANVTLRLIRTSTVDGVPTTEVIHAKSIEEKTVYSHEVTGQLLQPVWSGDTYSFQHLPAQDMDGNPYSYSVAEWQFKIGDITYNIDESGNVTKTSESAPDMKVTYVSGENGNVDIVNSEATSFEFSKIWNDISQQSEVWPEGKTITVIFNAYTNSETKEAVLTDLELTFGPENIPEGWTSETSSDGKKTTFITTGLAALTSEGEVLTYYVVESPIEGYKEPGYAGNTGESLVNADRALDGQQIVNSPEDGVELPSTGGPGIRIFQILGSVLILGTGILLLGRRRNN